jgi:outer membrane protein
MVSVIRSPYVLLFLILFPLVLGFAQEHNAKITIGIVVDGEFDIGHSIFDQIKSELDSLLGDEFGYEMPEDKLQIANYTPESIQESISLLLNDNEVDLIITFGVKSSYQICILDSYPKPVIALTILDPEFQNLPLKNGRSGKDNLTYVQTHISGERDIRVFSEMFELKHLALLLTESTMLIPGVQEKILQLQDSMDLKISPVIVGNSLLEVLDKIPAGANGVYVTILSQFDKETRQEFYNRLAEKGLPAFSMWGKEEVEIGAWAGSATPTDFSRLARRAALNIQRILLGENPADFKVYLQPGQQLTVNMDTVRKTSVYPRYSTMIEAELLNYEPEINAARLTLVEALNSVSKNNLSFKASEQRIKALEKEVDLIRANYLPQVDIGLNVVSIDEDRAEAGFGTQAQHTMTGSITATQVIYSEPLLANLAIQKKLREADKDELATLKLDLLKNTGVAYLNVLRAKTVEVIQRNNLKLTRSNLDLAQSRNRIGYGSPSEVYRWEAEVATSRKEVLRAGSNRRQAEVVLNQILNKPLEQEFITEESGLFDGEMSAALKQIDKFVDNEYSFLLLRDFMMIDAVNNAPELNQITHLIAAKERQQQFAVRSYWVPQVAAQASLSSIFLQEGAGTDPPDIDFSRLDLPKDFSLPEIDSINWNVAINATLSLYEGGAKGSEIEQTHRELSQLKQQQAAIEEQIRSRLRIALHKSAYSSPAIELTQLAAEAAHKSLDLVTDSYTRGVVDIITLLEAQNAALTADLAASNAQYDFLIDLMEILRAGNNFEFITDSAARAEWLIRLRTYFEEANKYKRQALEARNQGE